jgi:hypothetical protein
LRTAHPSRDNDGGPRRRKKRIASVYHRFNDDLKTGPHGCLDWVGYALAFKHAMSSQFARSQGRQQIADCGRGERPSSVLDIDDVLLGAVGNPGKRHRERPMRVSDSLWHRKGLSMPAPDSGSTYRVAAHNRIEYHIR